MSVSGTPKTTAKLNQMPVKASIGTVKTHNERVEIQEAKKGLAKHEDKSLSSIHKVEDKLSPYAKSMLSPFEFVPAQIPDANTFPSSCLRLTQKLVVTAAPGPEGTGLGNSFAICLGSLYTNIYNVAPNNSVGYKGGNLVPEITTYRTSPTGEEYLRSWGCYATGVNDGGFLMHSDYAVVPIVNTGYGNLYNTTSKISNGFCGSIDLIRPVSCAVKAQCIGPEITRQGILVGASLPRTGLMIDSDPSTVTFDRILNHPTAQLLPVNSGKAMQVNYTPTDNVNYEYLDPTNRPELYDMWLKNRGELWIVGYGLQDEEAVLVEITLGCEFIPDTAIIELVDTNPSFAHQDEMDQSENLAAVVPKVFSTEMISEDVMEAQTLQSNSTLRSKGPVMLNPGLVKVHSYESFGTILSEKDKKAKKENKTGNTKIGTSILNGVKDARLISKEATKTLDMIIGSVMQYAKML